MKTYDIDYKSGCGAMRVFAKNLDVANRKAQRSNRRNETFTITEYVYKMTDLERELAELEAIRTGAVFPKL